MHQADQGGAGQRPGGRLLVQHHDVLGIGLAGVGQRHHVVPCHDVGPGLNGPQAVHRAPGVGGQASLLPGVQKQPAVVRGDLEPVLQLLHPLHLVVHGAARILGGIAHHGEGGGLGRHGPGGDRAVEHIEPLPRLQAVGTTGGPLPAVDPEGLAGYLHHILAVPLRVHVQAGDGPVLMGEHRLDLSVIQLAVGKGLDVPRPRALRFGGGDVPRRQGRSPHGAEQRAAQRERQ